MDKMKVHGVERIEAVPVEPTIESLSPDIKTTSIERKRARAEANEKRIQELKDKLLDRGGMIIEPLKGDPFVLSRNHVPGRAEVTTYHTDGRIETKTKAEYDAQLARGLAATRFFKQSQQEDSETGRISIGRILIKGVGWLGGLFRKLITPLRN